MIKEIIINERLVRHESDAGMKLRQVETGALYDAPVDARPCQYTYEETDVPIEEEEATPEEILDILLGEGEAQ